MHVDKKLIHQTDLAFQRYIHQKFGINRGVYNTIDQWFLDKGYGDIVQRRTEIIAFLHFSTKEWNGSGQKIIFGSGKLHTNLIHYIERNHCTEKNAPIHLPMKMG